MTAPTTLVVRSGVVETPAGRAEQLTAGIYGIIEDLNAGVARGDQSIVVDFRVEAQAGGPPWPNALAYLAAVRGLVQSLTLELTAPAPAVNVVVSTDAEAADRDRTIAYLHSEDGLFARGTTFDLRSAT